MFSGLYYAGQVLDYRIVFIGVIHLQWWNCANYHRHEYGIWLRMPWRVRNNNTKWMTSCKILLPKKSLAQLIRQFWCQWQCPTFEPEVCVTNCLGVCLCLVVCMCVCLSVSISAPVAHKTIWYLHVWRTSYLWSLWSYQGVRGSLFQIKLHLINTVLLSGFQSSCAYFVISDIEYTGRQ